MRQIIFLILVSIIFIGMDVYLWLGLGKTMSERYFRFFKWILPFTSTLFFIGIGLFIYRANHGLFNATKFINYIFGIGMGMIVVKLIAASAFLVEDLIRLGILIKDSISKSVPEATFQGRRTFVKNISLGLASLPLSGVIYAITRGKYNFKNKKVELYSSRLPHNFNGLKIVHFTDFHAGSFDDFENVKQGMELINEENPDIIVFTGDLVNNRAEEAEKYLNLFKNLKAKHGKFAILGNHDYGDYVKFDSPEERIENLKKLDLFYEKTGFNLLKNKHETIEIEGEKLHILGVENWGTKPFPQYGDIEKASQDLSPNDFKIVLSHDPDHWEYVLRDHSTYFDLTLSGHTHGFQAGVNIPGFLVWSPTQYRYKRWMGLYTENDRHLYISKGFGYLGFPGRIGMLPEIVTIKIFRED